jgi:probable DNA repair protein
MITIIRQACQGRTNARDDAASWALQRARAGPERRESGFSRSDKPPRHTAAMLESFNAATILTPTARLARAERRRRAEARRSAGQQAWTADPVLTLSTWIAQLRDEALVAGAIDAVPISAVQARALWAQAIDTEIFVGEPRVAELAERAWRTVHEYRLQPPEAWPELLLSEDARAFRGWAERFQSLCAELGVTDEWAFATRLPALIASGDVAAPASIELVGRELPPTPLEQALLEALAAAGCDVAGAAVPDASIADHALRVEAFETPDRELLAAAEWARGQLEDQPDRSIAIVVPDLGERLEAVDRVFRGVFDPPAFALAGNGAEPWHVSLGPPLAEWPLVADALIVLQLDPGRLSQARASRLLRSPWLSGWTGEFAPRAEAVRRLMDRAPHEITAMEWARDAERAGAAGLARRIRHWQALRKEHRPAARPSDWVGRFQAELEAMGFGRGRELDSREFQALNRWHQLLEALSTLDVVAAGPVSRARAVALVAERARATRFRERDPGCPVEVLGVEEALGSRFDATWIATLDHENWPKSARRDPLIPGPIQAAVPTASGDGQLARARAELAGLLRTAPEVRGSFSSGSDEQPRTLTPLLPGVEATQAERPAVPEPAALEWLDDDVRAPAPAGAGTRGGTGVLRDQSACPFRAFAAHRLAAMHPQPPRPGLDAAARGNLIHRALELFWDGLTGRAELAAMDDRDLQAGIERAAAQAVAEFVRPYRHRLGAGGRALEQRCTARALTNWLAVERARGEFRVVGREVGIEMRFGRLVLRGKIDRVDETDAGTVLIDYKTGRATKSAWTPDPRIVDPQLPAYALALETAPAAIAFARLTADDLRFDGLAETDPGIPGVVTLADAKHGWRHYDDWSGLLKTWRGQLEALADAFVSGRAEVDPRDAQACRYCDLHALCRIDERQPVGRWLEDADAG